MNIHAWSFPSVTSKGDSATWCSKCGVLYIVRPSEGPRGEHYLKPSIHGAVGYTASNPPPCGFNSGGYQWCLQNWGTKWGIYDARIEAQKLTGKKGRVKFTCQSAWSPPIPVIKAMSDKFPSLKFKLKYYEMGMGFKGVYTVEGGTVLEDSDAKYNGHRGG